MRTTKEGREDKAVFDITIRLGGTVSRLREHQSSIDLTSVNRLDVAILTVSGQISGEALDAFYDVNTVELHHRVPD